MVSLPSKFTSTAALTLGCLALIGEIAAQSATAEAPALPDYEKYALSTPSPEYPFEARRHWLEGSGIAQIVINSQNGHVTSAAMLKSTGHQILDDAALDTFLQWRFKPGFHLSGINIPVNFKMTGTRPVGDAQRALAVFAPRPIYPLQARRDRLTGSGVALVDVDKLTGYVTSARMLKSMGHKILDDAALKAFRQWRFKPGTASQIKIPINYTIGGRFYK